MAASNVKRNCQAAFQILRKNVGIFTLKRTHLIAARRSSSEAYTDEEAEFQKRLQRLRDGSGLNDFQKARLHGTMPNIEPGRMKSKRMSERRFHRQMYARYGMSSGVSPSVLWPSQGELEDLVEIDEKYEPSFQELKQQLEERKTKEAEEHQNWIKKVDENMSKMDGWIKDFHKKQEKKAQKEPSDLTSEWLDEFREIYGFSVTESSMKFKAFKQKKREDLALQKKKEKRLSKKQQSEQYLQELLEKGSGTKF